MRGLISLACTGGTPLRHDGFACLERRKRYIQFVSSVSQERNPTPAHQTFKGTIRSRSRDWRGAPKLLGTLDTAVLPFKKCILPYSQAFLLFLESISCWSSKFKTLTRRLLRPKSQAIVERSWSHAFEIWLVNERLAGSALRQQTSFVVRGYFRYAQWQKERESLSVKANPSSEASQSSIFACLERS